MHQIRGLVRPAAAKTLKQIEQCSAVHSLTDCFRVVSLQDSRGQSCCARLLLPSALITCLDSRTFLETSETLKDALAAAGTCDVVNTDDSAVPTLYVKGTVDACREEVANRQRRFVLKLRGRNMAADTDATNEFVARLLERGLSAPMSRSDDEADDCSVYYGLLEALCTSDPRMAVAIGVNAKLPLLSATASHSLAQLVDITSPSAITTFLALVAEKDARVAAHERCATHLALRVRQHAPENLNVVIDNALAAVDPGAVFPTGPAEIQSLVLQQTDSGNQRGDLNKAVPLSKRAESVMTLVRRGQWLPRRVAMTSLSTVCLADLERPWLLGALSSPGPKASRANQLGVEATRRAARALVLKDSRRNLVDNRLLHEYAELLRAGHISAQSDASFAAFLEECGECHSSEERPSSIEFTFRPDTPDLPSSSDSLSVLDALVRLAPACSYWTTLLHHRSDLVSCWIAPCGEVRACVTFPHSHECCVAAADDAVMAALPVSARTPCVLWEDDDLVVVNKPAGIATSRHGLSTTQTATPITDLLSCLLRTRPQMTNVCRDGQVHRLDAGTTGCILFAKTAAAAASLRHQMGTSAAYSHYSKSYLALCAVLEPNLGRVPLKGVLHDRQDNKIQTAYRVVKFFSSPRVALVECRLQQGKKHQVRRHLAAAGLPLLGDVDHGGAACSHPLMPRVALHAQSLSFVHQVRGHTISVSAPLPHDFSTAVEQLESDFTS